MDGHTIDTAEEALHYILAGKSTLTVTEGDSRNRLDGMDGERRFTYQVQEYTPKNEDVLGSDDTLHFVRVLVGPENVRHYAFLGTVFSCEFYRHGRKSRIGPNAPSAVVFKRLWDGLEDGEIPDGLTVYKSNVCCRCGRLLTTPESIERGIGPVCLQAIAGL
jgi:hypothetical protein